MKLKLERETLEKKLQAVIAAMPKSALIPILGEALVKVQQDKMSITGSNNEVQVTVLFPAEVSGEPQNFVCDVRSMYSTISSLKSKEVFIELLEKKILFYTNRTKNAYELPLAYKADTFPSLADAEQWNSPVEINGEVLSKMVKKTAINVDPDNIRGGMRGIRLKSEKGTLTMVSTRENTICYLSAYSTEENTFPDMKEVLLPKSSAEVISNYESSPRVELSIDKKKKSIYVTDGSTKTYIRLVEGIFPNVETFLKEYVPEKVIKLNKEDLFLCIKRISPFLDKTEKRIILNMENEGLTVTGIDDNFNKKGEEHLDTEIKAAEMNFKSGINNQYLSMVLSTLSGENVYINQLGPGVPYYITDDSAEGFSTLWMLGPIILNS